MNICPFPPQICSHILEKVGFCKALALCLFKNYDHILVTLNIVYLKLFLLLKNTAYIALINYYTFNVIANKKLDIYLWILYKKIAGGIAKANGCLS